MPTFAVLTAYCLVCFVVAAIALRFMRSRLVYFAIAATAPPAGLVLIDVIQRGYLDAWASVAFGFAWLFSAACATAYYVAHQRLATRRRGAVSSFHDRPS